MKAIIIYCYNDTLKISKLKLLISELIANNVTVDKMVFFAGSSKKEIKEKIYNNLSLIRQYDVVFIDQDTYSVYDFWLVGELNNFTFDLDKIPVKEIHSVASKTSRILKLKKSLKMFLIY